MDEYYGDEEEYWEAVEEPENGGGCLSPLLIPPLLVVILGVIFSSFMWGLSTPPRSDVEFASGKREGANHPNLAPLFTPEIDFWGDQIVEWAAQNGLDPNLVATVMQIESCGDPRALSGAGAIGLFQVMPYHFEQGENPYYPATNALRGLNYLKTSLDTANGNYRLAFAGYNGGIGVIPKVEAAWAAETVRYVYWGSGIYADALQGAVSSARLDEWLGYGGASLCAQAHARQ